MDTTTTPTNEATFEIPARNLDILEERLVKLRRRAQKLGVVPPTVKVLDEYDRTFERDLGIDVVGNPVVKRIKVRFVRIEVIGPVVQANGWDFVATVEHTPAGNAIRKVPGFDDEIPTKYRDGGPLCEHCKTSRRRKDSFLCRNAKYGQWVQVGRNCLADFLGRDPKNMVWGLTAWDTIAKDCLYEEDSFFGGGGSGYWSFNFHEFMTAVLHYVRKEGWLSRGAARDRDDATATADRAWWLVSPSFDSKEMRQKQAEWDQVRDSDRDKAAKAIEWNLTTLKEKGTERNDYEQNLFIALSKPGVESRDAGIVASLVIGYMRHLEDDLKREEIAKKSNEWLWEVGVRVKDVSLTLVMQRSFEGDYGPSILHVFEDEAGNCVQWWGNQYATDKSGLEADIGDMVTASWTVKKHSDYQGRRQTVVFRPAKIQVTKKEEA